METNLFTPKQEAILKDIGFLMKDKGSALDCWNSFVIQRPDEQFDLFTTARLMVFWTKLNSNGGLQLEVHPYVEQYLIQHISKYDHTISRYIKDIVEEK
jgi:hypothetical protein